MVAASMAAEVRELVLDIDGRRAGMLRRLPRAGRGRPPLLLVPGAGDNQRCFEELLQVLPEDLELIVPALPGRDASQGPTLGSAAGAAAWLAQLTAALGLTRSVVVGYSFGGAVALEYALADAQRAAPTLAGLVLMATGARLRVHPAILQAAEHGVRSQTPVPIQRAHFHADSPAELVERVNARRALTPPATTHADWQLADAFDRMADLQGVRARTLVLAGALDTLTPVRYAHYLAQHIPQAELHVLEQGGHFFPVEQPLETAAQLDTFLDSL
jgi:pimeloyl-ACP methyl ester carboxylesterase